MERSLTCQVIPAIDVLDGTVVRLQQGDYDRVTTFNDDPVTIAQSYEEQGASRLHLVNLSGAKNGFIDASFIRIVTKIAQSTNLSLQVGGGIRSLNDMQILFDAGVDRIVLGTILFTDPSIVQTAISRYGADRFIAALDVKNGIVQIHGWQKSSNLSLKKSLQKAIDMSIRQMFITDISQDGMCTGPNVDLYKNIRSTFPETNITASGGIRNEQDIKQLRNAGSNAAVIGKAFLSGNATYRDFFQAANSDLAIRIIPCLDINNGRVVKGTSFQNLRDAGDPVELAKRYCSEGADELIFLDITATADNRKTVCDLAARVAETINIPFTIGGGIRSVKDAQKLLEAGADKVSVNSAAVRNPDLLSQIAQELGSANTVCAIDAKRREKNGLPADLSTEALAKKKCPAPRNWCGGEGWTVLISGGRENTGIDVLLWAQEAEKRGAGELLITSFDQDGQGTGFDTDLLSAIKKRVNIPIIASGGGGSLQTFIDAAKIGKADAVLAASVFHFEKLRICDVKDALKNASFPIRPI